MGIAALWLMLLTSSLSEEETLLHIVFFHEEIRPWTNTGAHGFLTNYIDHASRRG